MPLKEQEAIPNCRMYLKSISLENLGPIPNLDLGLPFVGDLPLPIVLVGPNGSGKTTVLSCIVNAMVAFKQQVFEEAEIAADKVYRLRSQLFLRGGASFYRVKLQFEQSLSSEEWVLDRPRERFEKEVSPLPIDKSWQQIAPGESNLFRQTPTAQPKPFRQGPNPQLTRLFEENVVLFFPSDRFEPPDWLNQECLSAELQFPEPILLKGLTARRIFSRHLLKPTLEWLQAVYFDRFLTEGKPCTVTVTEPIGAQKQVPALLMEEGRNAAIINSARAVLKRILGGPDDSIQTGVDGRNSRRFSACVIREGKIVAQIPNLLGLSAGQSALFCLFCNILRDFDLAGAQYSAPRDIRGIVLIDEADLHLHLDFQYRVLPELIRMFPKVQFILTAHSPMVVMGMRETFGEDGFWLVDMPTGRRISIEAYSEFVHAFEAFGRTKVFHTRMLDQVRATTKPLLFVEGKHDRTLLQIAWSKLKLNEEMPFQILSCGDDGTGKSDDKGGAKRLNAFLELLGRFERRHAIGLFDNDATGASQFGGLGKKQGFEPGEDESHRRHSAGAVHALLLPVPPGRESFAPPSIEDRILELEHYFSDSFLQIHAAAESPLYGSTVFRIRDSAKSRLSDAARNAPPSEFSQFAALFERLTGLLGSS